MIRSLHREYVKDRDNCNIKGQLDNLRRRMMLIKYMQGAGIMSFMLCVIDMFLLHFQWMNVAFVVFGLSLGFLLLSLVICFMEIKISIDALEMQVEEMEH